MDSEIAANTRRIARVLADEGHVVEEIELPIFNRDVHEIAFTHFGNILGPGMQDPVAQAENISPYTERFLDEAARFASERTLFSAIEGEYKIQQQIAEVFESYDLLLCPTSAVAELNAEENYVDGVTVDGEKVDYYWQAHMTLPFNIANRHPVLAVPSGLTQSGIPTGVQLVAAPFNEQLVFSVGHQLEMAEQWAQRFDALHTLPTIEAI